MKIKCLELAFKGEIWVRYPYGLRFPKSFRRMYPFRGKGFVAVILYILNKLRLDRVVLHSVHVEAEKNVALFWPSAIRSQTRYYGYRVCNGDVMEYLKFGMTEKEIQRLKKEAENVVKARTISNGTFKVPCFLKYGQSVNGTFYCSYESIPTQAKNCPLTEKWLNRVLVAHKCISDSGYSHGDFAWHNFKHVGDDLWILDWEEMSRDVPKLSDEISLMMSYEYYWKRKPLKTVLKDLSEIYLDDKLRASLAVDAIEDLYRRNMTMGDILHNFIKEKGLLLQ